MPPVNLPDPPLLEHWLLENPWPVAGTLAAVAVLLLVIANRRQQKRPLIAAGVAAGLAVGVYLLSFFVTTEREVLIERTATLVHATAPLRMPTFRAIASPQIVVAGPSGGSWLRGEEVFGNLERALARRPIQGHDVRRVWAQVQPGGRGVTVFDVNSRFDAEAGLSRYPTRWQLYWQRDPDGTWRVTEAQWLLFMGKPPARGLWLR